MAHHGTTLNVSTGADTRGTTYLKSPDRLSYPQSNDQAALNRA
ncbi:hypothetical protein [Streptomyces sp. DSM 110735]|nr:hypothetical protein [Streptomyces sp. DSM 110735]